MKRILLALTGGTSLWAGSATAFDGWCYCPPPPRIYYCPPPVVVYGPAIWGAPAVCPPAMPAPVVKDKTPPSPMPNTPKGAGDKAKGGLTPAEFRDTTKPSPELATPKPAPPPEKKADEFIPSLTPVVPVPEKKAAPPAKPEKKADEFIPSLNPVVPVPEKKAEPPAPMPMKPVDVPLPKVATPPATPDIPKLEVTVPGTSEPGKIPPLTIPSNPPKADAPIIPDVKPSGPSPGGLQIPSIDLPPPATPNPGKKSTSQSSPLATEDMSRSVSVRTVSGTPPSMGRYSVRFYNRTDAAFELAVDAGSITLPARHFVDVQIGRTFTWKAGNGEAQSAEIPAMAAGLEIDVKPAR